MRTRIPGGTIPPNVDVDLEFAQAQAIQDPIGGPPLEVSSHLVPDAMALYMLSTCIIGATRQLESHEAATRSHEAVLEQVRKAQERAIFWSRAVVIGCAVLGVLSSVSFAFYMWGVLHGH